MLAKTRELLLQSKYYIEYEFLNNQDGGRLYISWLNKYYTFKYNTTNNSLLINDDTEIPCPEYCVPFIIDLVINSVSEDHGYSPSLIIKKFLGNPVVNTMYQLSKESNDTNKFKDLNEIYHDMLLDGVRPEHISLAIESDILEGYAAVFELYLGVKFDISIRESRENT